MGQNNSAAASPKVGEGRERNLSIQNQHITQDYQIKKKLGQGNFALVRLCQRKSDKAEFAVKIIHKKRLAKPKQQQSIEREVDILKGVEHPHCVRLEAIYETNNHLYLILEYCKGGELFDMICQHSHFTEAQAVKVVQQVNDALLYLHGLGIVHRDIKPENILLLEPHPDSVVKLTDFGLANRLDGKDLKFWTSCGTLYYAAPEVLSTSSYTSKIDFWSLGVVMYVLLVGYLPFYHDNRAKTIDLIRRGRVHFDMNDWGDISPEARDLIRNLLQVDAKKRYGAEQIRDHDWLSEGVAPEKDLDIRKISKFQGWRQGFQGTVFAMMGIRRWKQIALARFPPEDDEDDYAGVGEPILQGDGKSASDDGAVEMSTEVKVTSKKRQSSDRYVPGVGFVIE